MPITQDEFRAALSRFASGVSVVTTIDGNGIFHGITVSAFCSVSLEPPLVLICVEKTTGSHAAIAASEFFAVNILSVGQEGISERFASLTNNKFDGVETRPGIGNVPIFEHALVNIECSLRSSHEGGDHTIFVGEVIKLSIRDSSPLVYFHGNYHTLAE